MRTLSTPSGVRFGLLGERGASPAPTLFVFAEKIGETLGEYFNKCGRILARNGFLSVALHLPCHGEGRRAGEPSELNGWRARLERGEDFLSGFLARASAVLDHLIREGYTDPLRVAAGGTSRGGFAALHFAAAEPRVRCVAAFAPVTDLLALREFAGMERHAATNALAVHLWRARPPLAARPGYCRHGSAAYGCLALLNLTEKLTGRPVWICIGNNDERVNTGSAIRFARGLVAAAVTRQVPAPVELHVMPTVGHTIHATAHDEATAWILQHIAEGR